jgi:hypothetical protein
MIKVRGQPRSPAIAATREAKAMVNFSLAEEKKEHSRPIWCQRCRLITDAQEIHGFRFRNAAVRRFTFVRTFVPAPVFESHRRLGHWFSRFNSIPATALPAGHDYLHFIRCSCPATENFPSQRVAISSTKSGTPIFVRPVVHALPTSQSVVNRLQRTLLRGIVVACATSRGDPCPARRSCSSAPIRKSVCAA